MPLSKAPIQKNAHPNPKTPTPRPRTHKSVAFYTLAFCPWHSDRIFSYGAYDNRSHALHIGDRCGAPGFVCEWETLTHPKPYQAELTVAVICRIAEMQTRSTTSLQMIPTWYSVVSIEFAMIHDCNFLFECGPIKR